MKVIKEVMIWCDPHLAKGEKVPGESVTLSWTTPEGGIEPCGEVDLCKEDMLASNRFALLLKFGRQTESMLSSTPVAPALPDPNEKKVPEPRDPDRDQPSGEIPPFVAETYPPDAPWKCPEHGTTHAQNKRSQHALSHKRIGKNDGKAWEIEWVPLLDVHESHLFAHKCGLRFYDEKALITHAGQAKCPDLGMKYIPRPVAFVG